jgi:hypothetical protein
MTMSNKVVSNKVVSNKVVSNKVVSNKVAVGHGHVTPNPDGSKARCGGPHMCPVCKREQDEKSKDSSSRSR